MTVWAFLPSVSPAVAIEWVTVGDPGNVADTEIMNDGTTGYGSVPYAYRISKYEVTNAQYCEFLNAVAAVADSHLLFWVPVSDPVDFVLDDMFHGIARTGDGGATNPYVHAVKEVDGDGGAYWANKPANFVDWYDCLRFANWLHNGQPTGVQDASTTEDGAYDMTVGPLHIARSSKARVFLPSEDEWYKAAYYRGGGLDAGYWDYATQSDVLPDNHPPAGDTGNSANYKDGVPADPDEPILDVGSYALSPGPYGTFDQNGNIGEWDEAMVNRPYRGIRGGSFHWDAEWLHAAGRDSGCTNPTMTAFPVGFRVAATVSKLSSIASGNWNAATTWDGGTLMPGEFYEIAIRGHTVTVATDGTASRLLIDAVDGKAVVNAEHSLTVVHDVKVGTGTLQIGGTLHAEDANVFGKLEIAPGATLSLDRDLTMQTGSQYTCELGLSAHGRAAAGRILASGDAHFGGALTLRAVSRLRKDPKMYGRTLLGLVTADGDALGTFDQQPAPGDHLGSGVFLRELIYHASGVSADLFEAACGDTDGDREVGGGDIENILAANLFGVPEPDPPADWTQGDFTGDGEVGGSDIQAILAANLFGTGPYMAMAPKAPVEANVELLVTPHGLMIDPHGTLINGYVLTSAEGVFTGEPADNLGMFREDTKTQITGNFAFALDHGHLLGDVVGDEFDAASLLDDLTFTYTVAGQSGVFTGKVAVPEPSALILLGGSGLGLMLCGWRRGRRVVSKPTDRQAAGT